MIRLESVTKKYDKTIAVDDLSLQAPSGQITVLVGPSGCGKTTSLRMINRMIEPTSGRILIDDRDTVQGLGRQAAPRHRLRHPARRAVPAPHRRRQHRHRPRRCSAASRQEARAPGAGAARAGRPRCRASPSDTRPSSPAASSSASASPARWRPTRR